MSLFNYIYLDYFSIGSLISSSFFIIGGMVFFRIKDKSRASRNLGLGLFILGLFVANYMISGSVYHPLAAFHRWGTVLTILPAIAYLNQTFYGFPNEKAVRFGKILLWAQFFIAVGFTLWFMTQTIDANYVYHFDGHYYDFEADRASYIVSLAILAWIIIFIASGIWRTIVTQGRLRWALLIFLIGVILATIVPAYFNTLSREGGMDRGTFQTVFDLFTIAGCFIIVIIYMNNTTDKTTFMAKIVLVSVVVFLVVLQGVSYFAFLDKESAYDGVKFEQAERYRESGVTPSAFSYAVVYDISKGKAEISRSENQNRIDLNKLSNGYEFAIIWQKINLLNDDASFKDNIEKILAQSPATFAGYQNAIRGILNKKANANKNTVLQFFQNVRQSIIRRKYQISKLNEFKFRELLEKFLKKPHGEFEPFRNTLQNYLNENTVDNGKDLRAKVLQFLEEVKPIGARTYREDIDGKRHYVSYVTSDLKNKKLVEVGYDYIDYRKYIHPLGLKFAVFVVVAMVVIIAGFPLFFSRALVKPLESLLSGVNEVNQGNYEAQLNVFVEDEIGFLSRSFNGMVTSIRESKQQLQDYAATLEDKVKERTAELQKAFEEVHALKKQQDGDYFLTSLLTNPLGANRALSETLNIDVLLEQKKKFEFRKWTRDIGGDTCITSSIMLKGKPHTVFLNADAMGKSMQGAGGILVLGSVFQSVVERTKLSPQSQDVFPEHWLKYTFIELHRVFEVFDGSMLISLVMGLVDDESGLLYYINAEHPWSVLYRNGSADFIERELVLRKLGTQGVSGHIEVATLQLEPKDVIILGSDGRDDLLTGYDEEGNRIINEDENQFLRIVEKGEGQLDKIREILDNYGDLTDDLSLLRIGFKEDVHHDPTALSQQIISMLNKARLAVRNGNILVAIAELEEANRIDNTQPDVMRDLIKAYLKDKQFEKAANLAEDYIHIKPADSEFLYIASYCHKILQNYKKAADYGERLRLRNHDMVKNLINLADVYYLQGAYHRSKLIIDIAANLDPHNIKVKKVLEALAVKNTEKSA